MLREFPISPAGTIGFTQRASETLRTHQGGALPRAPCLTLNLWIGYHSTAAWRTLSQGPGFLGSLEQFDLYKENVGPLDIALGFLSDVCFMWEVIDSLADQKLVFFVQK